MRRPLSALVTASAAALSVVIVAGCVAKVHGDPGPRDDPDSGVTVVSPLGGIIPLPDAPPNVTQAALAGVDGRITDATKNAAEDGAEISVALLDRITDQIVSNGNGTPLATASVAKLFIADDLLYSVSKGQTQLSAADRRSLDVMLRSSDDNAGEQFWNRGGGDEIVTRVASRYGLRSLAPPNNGRWWNTVTTAADLVRYYDMLLDGAGGLPAEQANIIIGNLAQSTPTGIDGYPQRFGIPDGLYGEQVAVKQGWMCCIGADWMHLSTGVIGPERRYVMVIGSLQPTNDATARATITQAVKTIFPGGHL